VSGCLAGSGESSDRSRNRGATGAEEAHKTPTERQRERKVDEAFSFLLRYHGGWWRRPSASSVAVVVAQSSVARCMQRVRSISTIEPATRLLTHKTSEAHFQDAQGHSSSLCGHLPRERERENPALHIADTNLLKSLRSKPCFQPLLLHADTLGGWIFCSAHKQTLFFLFRGLSARGFPSSQARSKELVQKWLHTS
jgi:hypothetical protein